MANSRSGDSVIDRLVRVLATFDAEHTDQSPSEIARRAGLPASTGHRVVGDLIAAGLLERDEDGRVRVGMRLWELATRGSLALGLRQAALPAMGKVQAALRQHTQLGVFDDDQVIFLERLSHPEAGANITRIAGRLPLHASSSGLVLLAAAPPEVLDRVLAAPLEGLAPETITDPAALRRKLAEIRRLGFAIAPGTVESVSTGIAVPVRDHGVVVAALGAVLPRDDVDEQGTVTMLRAAAREIEETLTRSRSAFG
jgi:DNA-binding IclR family transcriptional regulator